MALIERSQAQAQAPVLPQEEAPMPSLGGDVIVRGLMLTDILDMKAIAAAQREPGPGETEAQARTRVGRRLLIDTLARCVVLADGEPMWTAAQWDVHGAKHPDELVELFNRAQRLNGQDEGVAEKN